MTLYTNTAGRTAGTRRFAPGVAAIAIAAAIGVAAPLSSAFAGTTLYDNWSGIGDNGITVTAAGDSYSGYPIGPQAATITIGSAPSYNVNVWCIDFTNNIGVPNTYYDYSVVALSPAGLAPVAGELNAPQPEGLYTANNQTVYNELNYLLDLGSTLLASPGSANPNDIGSAIQIAIWTLLYPSTITVTGESATVATDVGNYLADAAANDGTQWGGTALISSNGEQQLAYGTQTVPVPEPASLALLAGGLLGLGALRRRNRAG